MNKNARLKQPLRNTLRLKFFKNVFLGFFLLFGLFAQAQVKNSITVAAAANLHGVLNEIITQYTQQTNQHVKVVFGSSGQLYQQITQGAQFDIFLSANEDFVDRLVALNYAAQPGVVYARGRLALVISPKSIPKIGPQWSEIQKATNEGRLIKFAIANPALAPYGLAAKQTLEKIGLLDTLKPILVLGGDVSQTMLFVQSDAAQAGMVPLSIITQMPNVAQTSYLVVDEKLHQPILQKMLLFKTAHPAAQNFYQYLQSSEVRLIWRRFGYE